MRLIVVRDTFSADATLGKLSIDGAFFCDTLEDEVRPAGVKVYGATAIPAGTYRVIIDHSDHFGRLLPHVLNVPNFEGIRIHPGNKSADTEGCILVGHRNGQQGWIGQSKDTFTALFVKMTAAITRKETITLTVLGSPK